AFSRIDVRDVNDGLIGGIEDLQNIVDVGPGIEKIADVELLKIFVAIKLLVVSIGNGIEFRLVRGSEDRLCISSEVGAGHRQDMHAVAGNELAEMQAQLVVG